MKSTRTDKQVGVVGGEEGPGAGRGGIRMKCNPSWAEWCVCVCRVSTYFQLPFISCQKKGVFPLSMFIHHPIHLRLSLSPHPPHRPPSPSPPLSLLPHSLPPAKWGAFLVFRAFHHSLLRIGKQICLHDGYREPNIGLLQKADDVGWDLSGC